MQIRKATMKDSEALLSLYEDLGYPTTASKLSRRLEMILSQPHYGCLLAERSGEILGFLGYAKLFFFEADGSYYRILALSVAKETRRQGIASRLIDELKNQAVKEGVNPLFKASASTPSFTACFFNSSISLLAIPCRLVSFATDKAKIR